VGISQLAQGLFNHVTCKIAYIQGRITQAIQIEVDQINAWRRMVAAAVRMVTRLDDYLRWVEIAVNATRLRCRYARAQLITGTQDAFEANPPFRFQSSNPRKAFVQNAKLVSHTVRTFSRYSGLVQLRSEEHTSELQSHSFIS